MANADAYFTVLEYQQTIGKSVITAVETGVITRQALSISRYLEQVASQNWNQQQAVRLIPSTRSCFLDLTYEDCPGIASKTGCVVTVNDVVVPSSDYKFVPFNAALAPEPKPYQELLSTAGRFWDSSGVVSIDALWGWPQVPSGVKDVAIELLAIWRAESPRATGRMNELQTVVDDSDLARSLIYRFLQQYRPIVVA